MTHLTEQIEWIPVEELWPAERSEMKTVTKTKESPILFTGEMVRAILDSRKTQTRRVIKPNPDIAGHWKGWTKERTDHWIRMCPYGRPGDHIWVRESWGTNSRWDDVKPSLLNSGPIPANIFYAADFAAGVHPDRLDRWRPSIHMPRWASRITLEITGVRVERVQEITGADAVSEGVCDAEDCKMADFVHRAMYEKLWDSINAKRGYGWDAKPWVWVIEFRRLP